MNSDVRCDEILQTMVCAAVSAGRHIKSVFDSGRYLVEKKNDMTPVTGADTESAVIIERILSERYPDFDILCEETEDFLSDGGIPKRLDGAGCFIVDPLDGTKCFVERKEDFAVSIALSINHIVISGVIYAPVSGVLYYASAKRGAYKAENVYAESDCIVFSEQRGGYRISVSDRTDNLIYVSGLYGSDKKEEALINNNRDKIGKIIKKGSCIKGCLIAEGKADVHYRFAGYTKEWDTAGMQIICTEAGAVFTDAYGNSVEANRADPVNRNGIRILNRLESELKIDLDDHGNPVQ